MANSPLFERPENLQPIFKDERERKEDRGRSLVIMWGT